MYLLHFSLKSYTCMPFSISIKSICLYNHNLIIERVFLLIWYTTFYVPIRIFIKITYFNAVQYINKIICVYNHNLISEHIFLY